MNESVPGARSGEPCAAPAAEPSIVERIEKSDERVHISIGAEPLSVDADRIAVIADPAEALDEIAADTVSALRAAVVRPRAA